MPKKAKKKPKPKPKREAIPKLDLTRAWVTWTQLGHGIWIYGLFAPNFTGPYGLVWGASRGGAGKNSFEVFHSYVLPYVRRQGVRAKINETILQQFDVIITGDGSKEGGMAFLKSQGYELHKPTGIYFLTRKKHL
jgi:hypothetical protein